MNALPSRKSLASNFPGPQPASTFLTVAASAPRRSVTGLRLGASEITAPTLRSRLAQPSSRRPMPLANESSTVELHTAHVRPTERSVPLELKKPFTPTTALSLISASVVLGLLRSTLPFLMAWTTARGSAAASTLRPAASAFFGLSPGPTPPSREPSIALWSCNALPQKAWSPKVSKRKISLPWLKRRCAWLELRAEPPCDVVVETALTLSRSDPASMSVAAAGRNIRNFKPERRTVFSSAAVVACRPVHFTDAWQQSTYSGGRQSRR